MEGIDLLEDGFFMNFVDRAKVGRSTATFPISGTSSKLWVVNTLTPSE